MARLFPGFFIFDFMENQLINLAFFLVFVLRKDPFTDKLEIDCLIFDLIKNQFTDKLQVFFYVISILRKKFIPEKVFGHFLGFSAL